MPDPEDAIRKSWLHQRNPWDIGAGILLAAVAMLILFSFRDYGMTFDEWFIYENGRYFLDWYGSGFKNAAIIDATNHRLYASFFNVVATLFANHSPLDMYETGHLLSAITGLLGILYAFRLGKLLGGPMAGFLSALILTLTPVYYGHSFINPKDLPFAVLLLVSLFYITRTYDDLPRLGWRSVVTTGIATGLTLGIRVAGLLLFAYFGLLIILWFIAQYRKRAAYPRSDIQRDLRDSGLSFLYVSLTAWIVMLAFWPYAQLQPFKNPFRAFLASTNFPDWQSTDLYRGEFIMSTSLPWHYLPTWLLVTLPEFYVLALAGTLAVFTVAFIRNGWDGLNADPHTQSKVWFLIFVAFFPLAATVATRPNLYDAYRHLLFVVPPLAVLSGVAIAWLLTVGLPRAGRPVMASLVVLIAVLTATDMFRLHPYEYVFFNRASGGLRAADGRFETEYWGSSYKEAQDWLIRHYEPLAPDASIRVANNSEEIFTSHYLTRGRAETRRFVPVSLQDRPDVVLVSTRWNLHLLYGGKVLHVVGRMGVPFVYVVQMNIPPQS